MNKDFYKMQKIAGLITESQFKQLVESLEQDIINFWGTLQDDAAQSGGEYKAKWDTQFFIEQYPEYSGRKKEIIQIVKSQISKNSVNEEKYAEPIVMIQNIVDNWSDGGIDAEAAMTRIDKILISNYEDESGEGFDN